MAELSAYLRLFRWTNLLIMAVAQVIFRYVIILPALDAYGIYPVLSHLDFSFLVLSTVFISAAAYAINDYFDLRIDRINKPKRIILGNKISRRHAILAHSLLNLVGVALGIYISFRVGYWQLAFVFVIIPALLWLYSVRYKRKFLVGNLVVAFLSAFVIAIVWIVEFRSLTLIDNFHPAMQAIGYYARIYAFFAFFITLIREIIKDAEDIQGDARAGCKTIPVVIGIPATRRLLIVLMILMILFVGYAQVRLQQLDFYLLIVYLLFFVQLPLLGLLIQGVRASAKAEFRRMQFIVKFVMVTGVLSMVLLSLYLR